MKNASKDKAIEILGKLVSFLRKSMIHIISVGPLPNHIAFIMDGNVPEGVRCATFYAFSIDNFKQRPDGIQPLMDSFLEHVEGLMKEDSLVSRYGIRVYFQGNLELLSEPVRLAAENAMLATAHNSKLLLIVCIAYTSTNVIVHAVQESCREKWGGIIVLNESAEPEENEKNDGESFVKVTDVDKNMYMAIAAEPDILIRTSGDTRLSYFLLWQTTCTYLYFPSAFWPEIGFRHLLWAILNFQRHHQYLNKRKKQM
uniref:Alkyl transferase n=2 Tax=Populus trichocarpa TaxID=3694 RepID=A0A2K2BD33_POPTR